MKKLMIALVSIFACITVGLIILLVVVINTGGLHMSSNIGFGTVKLVNTQTADLKEIDELTVDYAADDIVFYTSDTEEMILKEYKNYTPDNNDFTKITQHGTTLSLKGSTHDMNQWLFHPNRYGRMEIYLPADYSKSLTVSTASGEIDSDLVLHLTHLEASSTSGDITLNEIYAEEVQSSTTSGNITYSIAEGKRSFSSSSGDIKILGGNGDTSVSTTSGGITVNNCIGSLNSESSSGDVRIEASSGKKELETTSGEITVSDSDGYTSASSSSGDIRITELAGAGNFSTTSGEVKVEFAEDAAAIDQDIEIDTSSGDVVLGLPRELQFQFSAQVSSGDIRTSFDDQLSYNKDHKNASGNVGANPSIKIDISTTSGNIDIND